MVVCLEQAVSSFDWGLRVDSGVPKFWVRVSTGYRSAASASAISTGQWYHLAGTWDRYGGSDNLKIYVNGVLKATNTVNADLLTDGTQISIGRMLHNTVNEYFDGSIDNVMIFDRVLSEDEIKTLYNCGNLSYDEAGSLTTDQRGYEYEYDYENRIVKITKAGDDIAEFAYDALGRRIEKKDLIDSNNTRRYYYNYKWQVLCEYNGSDEFQQWYAYGNPYILDTQYAPRSTSNYGNPYLFTGRRTDYLDSGSLKIQYNRNRYYDYYTGRWLTHDPLGYVDGMNLYEYTKSNPIMLTDPVGGCAGEEPEPEKMPCKCFCVDQIIPTYKRINTGGFIGAQFNVEIQGTWKDWDKSFPGFELEWWEWFLVPGYDYTGENREAETWHELFSDYPHFFVFDEIPKEPGDIPSGCGDIKSTYTIPDPPGIRPGLITGFVKQKVYFAVRMNSTPGCPCYWRHKTVYALQEWEVFRTAAEKNEFQLLTSLPNPPGDPPFKYK